MNKKKMKKVVGMFQIYLMISMIFVLAVVMNVEIGIGAGLSSFAGGSKAPIGTRFNVDGTAVYDGITYVQQSDGIYYVQGVNPPPVIPNPSGSGATLATELGTNTFAFTNPQTLTLPTGENVIVKTFYQTKDGAQYFLHGGEQIAIEEGTLTGVESALTSGGGKAGSTASEFLGIGEPGTAGGLMGAGGSLDAIITGAQYGIVAYGITYMVLSMLGFDEEIVEAASAAVGAGFGVGGMIATATEGSWVYSVVGWANPLFAGVVVGAIVFALMYEETDEKIVYFNCQPWQAPVGGNDCEKCNDGEEPCSEYRCKSLGQACELLNVGSEEENCAWVNPRDVKSPGISHWEGALTLGYEYTQTRIRPAGDGSQPGRMRIIKEGGGCIEAWKELEFGITTIGPDGLTEPAQCKIDYNHTERFEDMAFNFGDTNAYLYNHTQKMSLPSPDAINSVAPELQNDGVYSLYVRCRDANGNENIDEYVVNFCVDPEPDTTAPQIKSTSIPNNNPVQFGANETLLEVYVNEPAECKWGRYDTSYENLENSMQCVTDIGQMNTDFTYTCRTTLNGIKDREDNDYFFRCKDQPQLEGTDRQGDRKINGQGYKFTLKGTEPIVILDTAPNGTISGNTNPVSVELYIETDHGYDNGRATCQFSTTENEVDYETMFDTDSNEHRQRQDLPAGDYKYYFKCFDLGGNTVYDSVEFDVEVDNSPPRVVRAYNDAGALKIITNEDSDCRYSIQSCNFKFDDGIEMPYANQTEHFGDWAPENNYYIRCRDRYGNLASSTSCSIIIRAYDLEEVDTE